MRSKKIKDINRVRLGAGPENLTIKLQNKFIIKELKKYRNLLV
jgi:hypothetical protein